MRVVFPQSPISEWPYALAFLIWMLIGAVSLRTILRYQLYTVEKGQHLFFGNVVGLALLWKLAAPFGDGAISIHFLGLGAAWLMLGEAMAFIALNAALAVHALMGMLSWSAIPVDGLLLSLALLPPVFLRGWLAGRSWSNPLVFIWLNGFLGSILGILLVMGCGSLLAWISLPHIQDNLGLLLPYAILLGFGEGFLNGTLASALVIFVPGWLYSMRGLREL